MKKWFLLCLLLVGLAADIQAQRKTDKLDRGLVAVNVGNKTFISWRRLAEEYYDVTYNVYCNNVKLNNTPLTVSNFEYNDGSTSSKYKVCAVVNGVQQPFSEEVTPWNSVYSIGNAGYVDLTLHTPIYARDGHTDMTSQYIPNDIEMADLDGDGQLDILLKRKSVYDESDLYLPRTSEATKAYDRIEAYKLDVNANNKLTLLWWIDVGPNMVSLNSTELNMLAFDWDKDGTAEVLLRGANGMIIHYINKDTGQETGTQVIGDNPNEDTRNDVSHIANATFTWSGAEYLLYLNGETGEPYPIGDNNKLWMEYPLKRLESGETDVTDAWWYSAQYNGGKTGILGHRDSKYFFGAPYLDGHNPSIFLARGIYTRHKMIAYDVNPQTHKLTQRWRWDCNKRNSPWFGQGYHNYLIADVDEDGRDEIVYGSMVIDDNGCGLYTTGYGHGDAQHVCDFDPYRKGMEMFACLEDNPYFGSNYRNAGTGEIYYKYTGSDDDGRCLAGNFFNDIPGSQGRSVGSGLVGLSRNVNGKAEELFPHDVTELWVNYSWLNFRLYWDGDLLDEILDSPAGSNLDNHEGAVIKYDRVSTNGKGTRLFNAVGSLMNNGTKNNACFTGDILGDWREEFILRTSPTTMRLYTTVAPTEYPIYSLWYDHQYRQAMGTQMQVYNIPPHPSFFLGELEGITVAPPPLTTEGRTVIPSGTNINSSYDGIHLLHNEYANTNLSVGGGAPSVLTINVPEVKSGTDVNGNSGTKIQSDGSVGATNLPAINTTTYTCELTGGGLTGGTRLIKQGNGILSMANAYHAHTGETNIWGGTVNFDGTIQNSPVWMNRHTTLNTSDGYYNAGLTMEYGATLNVGGASAGNSSRVNISELRLNFGSRVVLDVNGMGDADHDWLNATTLVIDDSKAADPTWQNYGPEYIAPVFQLNVSSRLEAGDYPIGNVSTVNGNLSKVVIECSRMNPNYLQLIHQNGKLYLRVSSSLVVNEPTFEIVGMAPCDLSQLYSSTAGRTDYYLPVVGITSVETNGQTPTLSGSFTDLSGNVTNLGSGEAQVLYSENYENATDVNDWTVGCYKYLNTGDGNYGNYVNIASENSGGNRRSYKTFFATNTDFYGSASNYMVEFDALFHRTNTDNVNELVLFGEGASMPAVSTYFATASNNYLFRLNGGNNSLSYKVDGSETTASIGDTWCHYIINIDRELRTVSYTVKNGSNEVFSGSYTANNDANMNVQGIGITLGRAWSYAYIDNILIKTVPKDLSTYTFTEPGTLEITASLGEDSGYEPSTTTFEVLNPYWMPYGKKFNEITGENITAELGNNWNTVPISGRWANWNKSNSIYGENYQMHEVINNSTPIYLGDEEMLYTESNSTYKPSLVEGFGVGRNSNGAGAAFHVINMLNDKAFIDYTIDVSGGANVSGDEKYEKHFVQATEQGTYDFTLSLNYTLAELYIYLPVTINDELCSAVLPQVIENGGAHVYRSSLSGDSWASMVVPFDMTASQVKETFGEDVVIGNLLSYQSEPDKVYFETETGAVKANVPFLIKGVTKTPPYLIMGITSSPVESPMLSTPNFDYIGTYLNMGLTHHFTTSDYFFMANSDKLKQVASDDVEMTVKGYRAWFHSNTGAQHSISVSFSDHQFPDEEPLAEDFGNQDVTSVLSLEDASRLSGDWYNLLGQKMTGHPMRRGVYIVNGRRVIIK